MPRSTRSSTNSSPPDARRSTALLLRETVARARRDPSEFAEFCFTDPAGWPLRQGEVHRALQTFLTAHRHALVELPRDHGKSLQACVRLLWELGRQPGLRIKIVCATDALAAERCRFLRDAVAHNDRLRLVFPELRPARPWEANRFTVRRPANVIGPSVRAAGTGTGTTGSRADLLLGDDMVDVRALQSAGERERVKTYFRENLMNLLEPDGRCWNLFTPWHPDDLNGWLKTNPAFALFRRAVGDELEPVWPERWPTERLAERRTEIGEVPFSRAYRLVCVPEGDVPIRTAWVKFWTEPEQPDRLLLSVDPAVSVRPGADRSALVVLARCRSGVVHCLEAVARRVSAPDLVTLIDEMDRRHQPEAVLFESNAAFAGIRDLMVRHARFGPRLRSVTSTASKQSRAAALGVAAEAGLFLLRGRDATSVHPGQQELFDEMTTFPFARHDDLLDATANGVAHLLERPEPRAW